MRPTLGGGSVLPLERHWVLDLGSSGPELEEEFLIKGSISEEG